MLEGVSNVSILALLGDNPNKTGIALFKLKLFPFFFFEYFMKLLLLSKKYEKYINRIWFYVIIPFDFCQNEEEKIVHHLHFTVWPDKSVPEDITSLVQFTQKVNSIGNKKSGPVIVHCR